MLGIEEVNDTITIKIKDYPNFSYEISKDAWKTCMFGNALCDQFPNNKEFSLQNVLYTERPYGKPERKEESFIEPNSLSNALSYMAFWSPKNDLHLKSCKKFDSKDFKVDRTIPFVDNFEEFYEKKMFSQLLHNTKELTKTIMISDYLGLDCLLKKCCFTMACLVDVIEQPYGIIPDTSRYTESNVDDYLTQHAYGNISDLFYR